MAESIEEYMHECKNLSTRHKAGSYLRIVASKSMRLQTSEDVFARTEASVRSLSSAISSIS